VIIELAVNKLLDAAVALVEGLGRAPASLAEARSALGLPTAR
jgi:hypothetical protein